MPYQPISEWTTNDGTVPSDITADTILEIIYRSGECLIWDPKQIGPSLDVDLWKFDDNVYDVNQYRKMKRV